MNQIEDIKSLVISIGGILSKLTEHGFEKMRPYSCSCTFIYVNRQLGVVVKRSYLMADNKPSARCIPTEVLHIPLDIELQKQGEYGDYWESPRAAGTFEHVLIQPFADTSKQHEAMNELEAGGYRFGTDFRSANVAHYNGEAVIIDW